MGTPEFAVPSLEKLLEAGFDIVGVITSVDKQAGRGLKITQSAIKKFAVEKGLTILQTTKLKDPDFLHQLKELKVDLQVVVAFRFLPEEVWSMPSLGSINLHASLLPDYRGAAPINHAIINGETEIGATTFFIEKEIDKGKLLLHYKTNLPSDWDAGILHNHLKIAGADLLLKTVKGIENNTLKSTQQNDKLFVHSAPKLTTESCKINWDWEVEKVYNFIRGLSPYPGAWTTLNGRIFKIFSAKIMEDFDDAERVIIQTDSGVIIPCKNGFISLLEVQLEGKKRMSIQEFLKGHRIEKFGS